MQKRKKNRNAWILNVALSISCLYIWTNCTSSSFHAKSERFMHVAWFILVFPASCIYYKFLIFCIMSVSCHTFIRTVRSNFRVCFIMNEGKEAFQRRCREFPSFAKNINFLWFPHWSKTQLVEHAQYHFKGENQELW